MVQIFRCHIVLLLTAKGSWKAFILCNLYSQRLKLFFKATTSISFQFSTDLILWMVNVSGEKTISISAMRPFSCVWPFTVGKQGKCWGFEINLKMGTTLFTNLICMVYSKNIYTLWSCMPFLAFDENFSVWPKGPFTPSVNDCFRASASMFSTHFWSKSLGLSLDLFLSVWPIGQNLSNLNI